MTECICIYICFLSPSPNKYSLVTQLWPYTLPRAGIPMPGAALPPPTVILEPLLGFGAGRRRYLGWREGEDVHPGSSLNPSGVHPAAGHVHSFNRELSLPMLHPCLSLDPGDIPSLDKESTATGLAPSGIRLPQ